MQPDPVTVFCLDGQQIAFAGPPATPLIKLLREEYGKTGVKLGCSRGVCGSCTVLVNGTPGAACSLYAWQVEGADVLTPAGLSPEPGKPHAIAAAFTENTAFQCGYCTGGMMLLTKALLDRDPEPTRETIIEWISSSVCRCTGYEMIVEAVLDAARRMRTTVDA